MSLQPALDGTPHLFPRCPRSLQATPVLQGFPEPKPICLLSRLCSSGTLCCELAKCGLCPHGSLDTACRHQT